jgi:hypothetical protein
VPHSFKSIRKNLLSKNFWVKIEGEDRLVSCRDIRDVFVLDQSSTLARGAVRLSSRHITPNSFERMSVKLAAQVFSASTAALIFTAIKTGQLKSQTAEWTAKFVVELNNLFDVLNCSRNDDKNSHKCAISELHKIPCESLENAVKFIHTWFVSAKNSRTQLRPPCFDGLKNTVKGLLFGKILNRRVANSFWPRDSIRTP